MTGIIANVASRLYNCTNPSGTLDSVQTPPPASKHAGAGPVQPIALSANDPATLLRAVLGAFGGAGSRGMPGSRGLRLLSLITVNRPRG